MSKLRRLLSLLLSFHLFLSQAVIGYAAETNFWRERKQNTVQLASLNSHPSLPQPSTFLKEIPVLSRQSQLATLQSEINAKFIQKTHGKIPSWARALPLNAVEIDRIVRTPNNNRWIVLLQDIHQAEEAQRNISKALDSLSTELKSLQVGVEGAAGTLSFNAFKKLADNQVVQDVAEDFLKKGFITGAEFSGLTSTNKFEFFGLEDSSLYARNVDALLRSKRSDKKVQEWISEQQKSLRDELHAIVSFDLSRLYDQKISFEKGDIPFGTYLNALNTYRPSSATSETAKFLRASKLEKNLDMPRVEAQRSAVLERLSGRLSKAEQKDLIQLAFAYRSGDVSYASFYTTLKELCQKKGLDLNQTPAFNNYLGYVALSSSIDRRQLFSELQNLETTVVALLIRNQTEQTLWDKGHSLSLSLKLARLGLVSEEWETVSRDSFIQQQDLLKPYLDFYAAADARNKAMVDNLTGKSDRAQVRALIVGGFHTEGIARLLESKNYNTLVLSPKISTLPQDSYLSIFSTERTSLDQIIAGDKLFLQHWLGLAPENPIAGRLPSVSSRSSSIKSSFYLLARSWWLARGLNRLSGDAQQQFVRQLQNTVETPEAPFLKISQVRFVPIKQGGRWNIRVQYTSQNEVRAVVVSADDASHFSVKKDSVRPSVRAMVLFSALHAGPLASLTTNLYEATYKKNLLQRLLRPVTTHLTKPVEEQLLKRIDDLRVIDSELSDKPEKANKIATVRTQIQALLRSKGSQFSDANVYVFDESMFVHSEKNFLMAAYFDQPNKAPVLYLGKMFIRALAALSESTRNQHINALIEREIALQKLLAEGVSFNEAHRRFESTMSEAQKDLLEFAQRLAKMPVVKNGQNIKIDTAHVFDYHAPEHHEEDRLNQKTLEEKMPEAHAEIMKEAEHSKIFSAQMDASRLEELAMTVEHWVIAGTKHIIILGDDLDPMARNILTNAAGGNDINHFLKSQSRPQVHFVEAADPGALARLQRDIPEYEFSKTHIVNVGSDLASWSALIADLPSTYRREDIHTLKQTEAGLFAATIVHRDLARDIHEGSLAAFKADKELSGSAIVNSSAHQWAAHVYRMGQTGQTVHVLLAFTTALRYFSPWLAARYNRALGKSDVNLIVSGEWATAFLHSAQQAWRQARGLKEKIEALGFISLSFISLVNEGNAQVGQKAHPLYRGFGYRFLLRFFEKSLGIVMYLANRPVFKINANVRTPYELGQFIYLGEKASLMLNALADNSVEHFMNRPALPQTAKMHALPDQIHHKGGISSRQNTLNFSEEGKASGLVWERIASETEAHGKSEALKKIISIMKLVAPRIGSKMVKEFQNKAGLDHLSSARVEEEAKQAEMAAERFKDKEVIYVISIGGSTTGAIVVDTLGLKKGPRIVEVQSIDGTQMEALGEEIRNAKDPSKLGFVVISKSGVTLETEANAWTMADELTTQFPNVDIKRNTLLITDPKVGSLRARAKREGWFTLDHPVAIGGRFSMLSGVGLFVACVKGANMTPFVHAAKEEDKWDEALAVSLKAISKKIGEKWDPKTPEEVEAALFTIYSELSVHPGLWDGFIDNLNNQVLGRDTEITLAADSEFEQLISHYNPFNTQVEVESRAKAGIRFYLVTWWGWNAIRDVWHRLFTNKLLAVNIYHVDHRSHTTNLSDENNRRFNAIEAEFYKEKVPFVATSLDQMTPEALVHFQFYRYRRIHTFVSLFSKGDPRAEGQDGVEQVKAVQRTSLQKTDVKPEDRKHGTEIATVPHDRIEESNEVQFDLTSAYPTMNDDLKNILTSAILGKEGLPGLGTMAFQENIQNTPKHLIPEFMANFYLDHFENSDLPIKELVLDGNVPMQNGKGRYVIAATSLESRANLLSSASNGTNFGIYYLTESGKLEHVAVQVQFGGAATRITISYGSRTQDYVLKEKDGGLLVENERVGDDNSVLLSVNGTYVAMGGVSSERPAAFREYEQQVFRSLNTSGRYSDAVSADITSIFSKGGGLYSDWLTPREAYDLAQTVGAAGGMTMTMTADGMRHVRDLPFGRELLLSTKKIYVFAGSPNQVRQVQVYVDLLGARNAHDQPVVYDLVAAAKEAPIAIKLEERAALIAWLIQLQQIVDVLPKEDVLGEQVQAIVKRIKPELSSALEHLNVDFTKKKLLDDYLKASLQELRQNRAKFALLGADFVGLQHNPEIDPGEAMSEVYELKDFYLNMTSRSFMDVLTAAEASPWSKEKFEPLARVFAQHSRVNFVTKPEETPVVIPVEELGMSLSEFTATEAGIPDGVKRELGFDSDAYPEDIQQLIAKFIDIYAADQDVTDALRKDEELSKLRNKEPSIFYIKNSRVYVKALHVVRTTLKENKYAPDVNVSGDVSSRLDHIFNTVFVALTKGQIHSIISEESGPIIVGERPDGGRVVFLDPIDGSSQTSAGQPFGKIISVGVMKPGQAISQFNPRTQMIGSFDVRYGWPRTVLTLVNRKNRQTGKSEVVEFELVTKNGIREFRFARRIPKFSEGQKKRKWKGLMPVSLPGEYIALGLGGSFIDSQKTDGHPNVIKFLIDKYGYRNGYRGALVDDVAGIIRLGARVIGRIMSYGATAKHKHGRMRRAFEMWHYALMFEALGGELIDGLVPMLDTRLPDEEPSGDETVYYAGDRPFMKFIMAFRNLVEDTFEKREVVDKDVEDFFETYTTRTEDLIQRLVEFSKQLEREMSEDEIREGIFAYNGNIWPLVSMTTREAFNTLFPSSPEENTGFTPKDPNGGSTGTDGKTGQSPQEKSANSASLRTIARVWDWVLLHVVPKFHEALVLRRFSSHALAIDGHIEVENILPSIAEEVAGNQKRFDVKTIDLNLTSLRQSSLATVLKNNPPLFHALSHAKSEQEYVSFEKILAATWARMLTETDPNQERVMSQVYAGLISLRRSLHQADLRVDQGNQLLPLMIWAMQDEPQAASIGKGPLVQFEDVTLLLTGNATHPLALKRAEEFARHLEEAKKEGRPLVIAGTGEETLGALTTSLNQILNKEISAKELAASVVVANSAVVVSDGKIDVDLLSKALVSESSLRTVFGFKATNEVRLQVSTDDLSRFTNLTSGRLVLLVVTMISGDSLSVTHTMINEINRIRLTSMAA